MLHLYAALAEKERRLIAERTKAALTARKAPGSPAGQSDQRLSSSCARARGSRFRGRPLAANVLPVIRSIQAPGVTGLAGLAAALNACGIPTSRGGRWHVSTVRNVLRRQPRLTRLPLLLDRTNGRAGP